MSLARNLSKLAAFLSSAGQTQAAGIADGAVTYAKLSSDLQGDMNAFKNRIINGAMTIDQRNAGASMTPADAAYTLDRWRFSTSQASKFTVQQSTTAPAGFRNSMLITVASAVTPSAGDAFGIFQPIEGFNFADMAFGSASAQTISISFWARSSLTGTFSGMLFNSAANRVYCFTYTINSANTFEYKTVTVAGDTTGTWLTDNGVGLSLYFDLGSGSNHAGTAGVWGSSVVRRTSGSVQLVATAGATLYITGVQLEKGSTATSFDYRPYGTELALCQRYYWQENTGVWRLAILDGGTAEYPTVFINFPVEMRSTPAGSLLGSAQFYYNNGGSVSFTPANGTVGTNANRVAGFLYRASITNSPGAAQSQKVGQWFTQTSWSAEL